MEIRYDYKMINFLKKNNTHPEPGQAKLVPWKSGGQAYDFLIPTTATIASTITSIVSLVIGSLLIKGIVESQSESWKVTEILLNILGGLQMPILIALTIRAARRKKPSPVIPKGPMFHDNAKGKEIPRGPMFHDDEINDQGEEIQMEVSISIENHVSISSHESVFPNPNVIFVEPCSGSDVECHI